jgi:threonine aldolase
LENTHNRGGGRVLPYNTVESICSWAHDNGLATHLDGARLFNAAVASGISASEWAKHFDTVSICFSKGLGAPVGSALAGPRDLIAKARRARKLFGGGMRQAGTIAAAALYALEHHIDRLAEDHEHAQILAEAIRSTDGLELRPPEVDTNLVIFSVDPQLCSAPEFSARLKERGVLINAFGPTMLRAVTHLDVSRADCEVAAQVLQETAASCTSTSKPAAAVRSAYA